MDAPASLRLVPFAGLAMFGLVAFQTSPGHADVYYRQATPAARSAPASHPAPAVSPTSAPRGRVSAFTPVRAGAAGARVVASRPALVGAPPPAQAMPSPPTKALPSPPAKALPSSPTKALSSPPGLVVASPPAIASWIGAPALEPDGDALVIPFRGAAPACALRRTSASWLELDCAGAGLDGAAPRKGTLDGPTFGTWFSEARTGHAALSLKLPPGKLARAEVRRTLGVIRVVALGAPAPAPPPRPAGGRVAGVRPEADAGGIVIGFQGADPLYEVSFQGPRLVVVTFPEAPPTPPGRWSGEGAFGPITSWTVTPTVDGLGTRVALELRDAKDAIVVSERPGGGLLVSGPLPAGAPGR